MVWFGLVWFTLVWVEQAKGKERKSVMDGWLNGWLGGWLVE